MCSLKRLIDLRTGTRDMEVRVMRSCLELVLVIGVVVGVAAPDSLHAQPPYQGTWGFHGSAVGAFDGPVSVASDAAGGVCVADFWNSRVQVFSGAGEFIRSIGAFGDSDGQLHYAGAVAVGPSGDFYVLDATPGGRIQRFTSTGVFVLKWTHGSFERPNALAVDASENVYVSDHLVGSVFKFTGAGAFLGSWSVYSAGDGVGPTPVALAVSGSELYVVDDSPNMQVKVFTLDGGLVTRWGGPGHLPGQFTSPNDVGIGTDGSVYVSDRGDDRVQQFTPAGEFVTQWGGLGVGPGQFDDPAGIACDALGNIFVADSSNDRIQKFGPGPVSAQGTTWGRLKTLYR